MKISENQFAIASVGSIVGLLLIWVIPETIALRHLLLCSACISAFGLIRYNWARLKSVDYRFIPLLCIFSLFLWVLVHYAFFSLNPELELSEIQGLWIRSILGAIAAIGLGIAVVKYSKLRTCFYVALFLTPAINIFAYCWASYWNQGFIKPNDFLFFLFAKIETAYFGAIASAVAVGNLIHLMAGEIDKPKALQILGWFFGLAFVLISAFISSTMNGMAIAAGLCFFLALIIFAKILMAQKKSKKLALFLSGLVFTLAFGLWQAQNTFTHKGWGMVFYDAKLALDIKNNLQWQTDTVDGIPLNELGHKVAPSTYTRFAYASVGIDLINQYPLGYGSINQSFDGLLRQVKIKHVAGRQAHSGWIDFGLAFGVPGLVLIFSCMLSTIYFGLKSKSSIALPWVIVCLAFIPFGLIAEISYKQYFEATIFFLTLGSTVIIFTGDRFQENLKKT